MLVLLFTACSAPGATSGADNAASPGADTGATPTDTGATPTDTDATPGADPGATSETKPVLTIGIDYTPNSLDPAQDTPNVLRTLSEQSILRLNPDGSFGPGLATEWGYVGEGNTEFEFTLRRDARFSDGESVTAEAVKAWLEYFPTAAGPYVDLMQIESIETNGDWTVRLHLAAPSPIVPFLLSEGSVWGAVVSPKALEDPSVLGTATFGAGPYVLDPSETVTGDHYTFVPNEFFYDQGAIRYSKVVARVVATQSSLLQAAKTGQVDVVVYGDATTADAAAAAGLEVISFTAGVNALRIPDKGGVIAEPLADVRVRRALNYAIDRDAVTEAIVGQWGAPTSQIASLDGYDPEYEDYYSYDPEKAKSLLAQAGYPDGFKLEVLTFSGFGNLATPATQAVAQYLADVGVELEITEAATLPEYVQHIEEHTFPLIQNTYISNRSMWMQYGFDFQPDGFYNWFGWEDEVITELWQDGQVITNPAESWLEISRRSVTEAYAVPISTFPGFIYVSDRVGGVVATEFMQSPFAPEWFPT